MYLSNSHFQFFGPIHLFVCFFCCPWQQVAAVVVLLRELSLVVVIYRISIVIDTIRLELF